MLAAWVMAGLWWWRLDPDWFGVVTAILLTLALRKRYPSVFEPVAAHEQITIDDDGLSREVGAISESIRWDDLCRVTVITTDEGPFVEDFFFALHDRTGGGCLVPQGKAVEVGLLERLQRLPGFDDEALIRACGSTDRAQFVVWDEQDHPSLPA